MFLSVWREFPSAPCLAGGKKIMTAHVSMLLKSHASEFLSFLVWLNTYQHPGTNSHILRYVNLNMFSATHRFTSTAFMLVSVL